MDLNEVLGSIPLSELLETVTSKARKSSKDVCSYIRAIFEGSTETSDESENRRFETFKSSLMILKTTELSLNTTSELVSLLLMKVDSLCTSNLMKIAEFFVDQVLNTSNLNSKCLEIFTKVLLCLSQRDSIVYQGSDMSGLDLRKNVIMSLFSEELPVSCVVQIISILKEIDLVEDEMKLVSNNLLRSLEDIDPVELPPFIYQLLLLSTKGDCKRILQGVLAYFIKNDHRLQGNEVDNCLIDDNNEIQFRQMEGTAVFFLSVASSHDRTIGKEFTALFKKLLHMPELVLSPFMFASALSLSKVQTNKDDLFESLKKTLSNAYQLNKKKSNSLWMRETMVSKLDVLDLVKEAIKSSGFGWDHICQGLVKFGFSVIETFGPKSVCGHTTKPVSDEGCALGSHILLDTFKGHRIVRTDIVDELLNRVVTKSQKPVQHYIDIFSQLVHKDSLFLLEVLPKLVEMLDYIHFLPHKNAVAILQALTPLLRISMPLKDTLMLVLRKALFHRDVEARKVAVSGYLILLKKLNSIGKVTLSQSQSCISSQASSASMISTQVRADVYVSSRNATSQAMCLEIMGLMKRVLTQQCCVRQLLYQGLYEITLKNKPLTSIVLELLLGGFEKYYISDEEADVPLLFEACYKEHNGTLVLEEPLSDLIKSVHLTLLDAEEVSEDEEGDVSARKMLLESLHSLSSRLSEANSDVLEISKKTDDDAPSVDVRSELVLSVYEALLEFTLLHMVDYNVEDCEKLLQLYYRYKENYEKANEKKKTAKKSTKSKTSPTFPPISVSIRYFAMIMEGLFTDGTFKHQQGLNLLRSDAAFVTNTIKACNQKLSKLSESGVADGFSEVMGSFYYLIKIARVYFKTYNDGLNFTFSSLEWEKMSLLFADGLAYIFTYVNSFQAKNSEKFILGICNDISCSTVQATQIALKTIQKSIMKLLADTENDLNLKETVPLLSVIRTLYDLFTKDIGEDLFKWLKQLCSQQVFQNTVVAKSFVALCLTLAHQTKHISTLLREMAFDIHYHLDDIDPDENVQGSTKYNILTADVSRSVIQNVISNSEVILDEVECALNILKSNISVPAELLSLASENSQNQSTAEGCISVRLSELILVFHELVQTSVPLDNTSGVIFKLITKFYRILGSLTKYYLLLHTKSKTAELHTNFEKLVKLSHTKLTTQVYSFITYIQTSSEGNKKKTKSLVAAQKAMRDMKTVPALVFNIESYEKNLIVVSKKYNKNLMNHMKLSTARDFRINPNVIVSSLEQSQESEASTVQNGDVNEAENESSNENQDDETEVNSNETSLEPDDDEERPSASVSTSKPSSSSRVKKSASNVSSRSKLSRSVSKKLKTSNDTTLNNTRAERTEIINENMEVDEKENEDAREDKVKPVKRKRLGVRGNTKKAK